MKLNYINERLFIALPLPIPINFNLLFFWIIFPRPIPIELTIDSKSSTQESSLASRNIASEKPRGALMGLESLLLSSFLDINSKN